MTPLLTRTVPDLLPNAVRHRLPGGQAPTLLELDLSRGLLESSPPDPLSAMRARRVPTLRTLVERLRQAEQEDSVVGLIAHVGPEVLTASQAEELGAAVESFRASGRPTVCWTESFGEFAPGTVPYLFALHFDEIWLQPSGALGLLGVSTTGVFIRDALDKLGLEPQFGQRHEYKSAADLFMRSTMSEPQREALQRLADSVLDQVVAATASRRGLAVEQVRAAVDAAPLTAQQALDGGFVDRLGYREEAYDELRHRLADDGRLTLRYVERWTPGAAAALRSRTKGRSDPVIGVVPVIGAISVGRSGGSPVAGGRAGSDTVTAALRAAADSEDVRAVVLRVVSPGGSYVASDAIREAVLRVRAQDIPVVASMGSVAASGGYFVSMPCDEVVATPSTITGSIGVLGGKVVTGTALRRIGIGIEPVAAGPHGAMFRSERRFDDEEWERVDAWLDEVYDDFTHKAAHDRALSYERLEPNARGRVWTGADALELGLVDQLGGLRSAAVIAARRAGVDPERMRLRTIPHLSPIDRVRPPQSSEAPAAAAALWSSSVARLGGPEATLRALWSAVTGRSDGVLTLPGSWDLR